MKLLLLSSEYMGMQAGNSSVLISIHQTMRYLIPEDSILSTAEELLQSFCIVFVSFSDLFPLV
jgi:hypothetical protein